MVRVLPLQRLAAASSINYPDESGTLQGRVRDDVKVGNLSCRDKWAARISGVATNSHARGPRMSGRSSGRNVANKSIVDLIADIDQILLNQADIEAKIDVLKADGDARDIAIAALTSPNVPSITFNPAAYAIASLIAESLEGTWTAPNASSTARVREIYIQVNGQDITGDGTLTVSDTSLTSGTFSLTTAPLNLLIDGVNATVTIVNNDGVTATDTASLTVDTPSFDPLRELAGHPAADTTIASWNTAPTWYDDTGSGLPVMRPGGADGGLQRTTTGYHGAAGIPGSASKSDFQYAATNVNHSLKFGIGIPSGSVLNWQVFVNGVSQATGTVTGPVYLMGDPREITVDLGEYTSTVGQVVKVNFWTTVGGGAPSGVIEQCVWQYSEVLETSAAKTWTGSNYFIDSVAGNNGTAVVNDPSLPWASLRYLIDNVTIPSGTATTPTIIWMKRGHSETAISGAGQIALKDKQWVTIKPYGSGPLPIVDCDYEMPASSVYYTATNTGAALGNAPRAAIALINCVSCGIEGLKVVDSAGTAIAIRNTSNAAYSNSSARCWVRYCHTLNPYSEGILVESKNLDSEPGTPAYIVDPHVDYNWVEGSTAYHPISVITGKFPLGQSLTIHRSTGSNVTCIGNYLDLHWKEGIDLIEVDGIGDNYARVLHNRVYGVNPSTTYGPRTGAYCDASDGGCSKILFEGNWIGGSSDNLRVGMACVAESGGTAEDIIFRNNLVHDVGTNCLAINDNGSGGINRRITIQGNTWEVPSARVEYVVNVVSTGPVLDLVINANSFSRPSLGAALRLLNLAGATYTMEDNHFFNGSNGVTDSDVGTSAIIGDPQWATQTSNFFPFSTDYYPGASSPLLGETTLNAKRDMFKVRRGTTQDIGAFERV